jgi:hypothetical protein
MSIMVLCLTEYGKPSGAGFCLRKMSSVRSLVVVGVGRVEGVGSGRP